MNNAFRSKRIIQGVTVGLASLGLAACDVDQTRQGEMPEVDVKADAGQVPKYDMVKTQEGEMPSVDVDVKGGQVPEYSVDGPEVTVGTKEVTTTVPDVDVDLPEDDKPRK